MKFALGACVVLAALWLFSPSTDDGSQRVDSIAGEPPISSDALGNIGSQPETGDAESALRVTDTTGQIANSTTDSLVAETTAQDEATTTATPETGSSPSQGAISPTTEATAASTTVPPTVRPSTGGGTLPQGRLYGGWCRSGHGNVRTSPGSNVVSVSPGQSIDAAIAGLDEGVVELQSGVHLIDRPIELRSNIVLRGNGSGAVIRTTRAMDQMVILGGGHTQGSAATISEGNAFSKTLRTSRPLSVGLWQIGNVGGGQIVKVVAVDGSRSTLELPLAETFTGTSIAPLADPITNAGLERVRLEPRHSVQDLIMVRSATLSWVNGVETEGSGGQIRSAVYLRQSYRVVISNNNFSGARELGDGGQGYGVNIANNTTNSVIEDNRLRLLRHSILLHAGAAGNVVRSNTSTDTRHPNFVEGGPADISFHGYASANLVESNDVERIQISDAGRPGPHNAIVGNTLRFGPLTLDNGVDNLTLLGNVMEGTVEQLQAHTMPSIRAVSTAGNPSPARSYWRLGYDPFGRAGDSPHDRFGDGILDWGSGNDVFVDSTIRSVNYCSL